MSKMKRTAVVWCCVIGAFGLFCVATERIHTLGTMNITREGTKELILIDPGHGGADPGKVGVAGTHEKDLNLEISNCLEKILAESGYSVEMTRREDVLLGNGETGTKKIADLKERVKKVKETKPALVVSIHQNSYPGKATGAQVFYYKNSIEGAYLAKCVQTSLRENLDSNNQRVEKANGEYFLLKNVSVPTVIVECGFLSDVEEERRLGDRAYQQKLAEAIAEGIENFLYK